MKIENREKFFFPFFYGIFLTVDFKELYRRLRFGVKMVFFDNLKHFEGWSGVMRVVKLSKETYDVVSHFSNPWSTSVDLLVNNLDKTCRNWSFSVLFYGIFLTVDFKELYRRLRFGVKDC